MPKAKQKPWLRLRHLFLPAPELSVKGLKISTIKRAGRCLDRSHRGAPAAAWLRLSQRSAWMRAVAPPRHAGFLKSLTKNRIQPATTRTASHRAGRGTGKYLKRLQTRWGWGEVLGFAAIRIPPKHNKKFGLQNCIRCSRFLSEVPARRSRVVPDIITAKRQLYPLMRHYIRN